MEQDPFERNLKREWNDLQQKKQQNKPSVAFPFAPVSDEEDRTAFLVGLEAEFDGLLNGVDDMFSFPEDLENDGEKESK